MGTGVTGFSRFAAKAVAVITRIMIAVSMASLLAMVFLTVADVLMRLAFSKPIPDSIQLTEYLLVCGSFLGMAYVALKGDHVTVDLLVTRFSPRVQAIVDSVTFLLVLLLCVLIAWQSFLEAPVVRQLGSRSAFFGVPTYPFYLVQALSFAVLCLAVIIHLVRSVYDGVKK